MMKGTWGLCGFLLVERLGFAGGANIAVPQAIWHLISNWGAIYLGGRCESVRCIGQALLKT